MRTIILFVSILLITSAKSFAQSANPINDWQSFTLESDSLGTIKYHVTKNKLDQRKPVFLYLDGSGGYPLIQVMENRIGSSIAIPYHQLSEKYHVVVISKPGVPFADTMKLDPIRKYPIYNASEEYAKRLSLSWRVNSAKLVLTDLKNILNYTPDRVVVFGISEGFQVGAKLLSEYHEITHAMLFMGNGVSQFYDFIAQNRLLAANGSITQDQAKTNIDSIYQVVKNIQADPKSSQKTWYGHTYLRWSSFGFNNPSDDLLSRNIPIYILSATQDFNTSVLGTDYMYLKSIIQNKGNITYKTLPYDHSLNEYQKDDKGNIIGVISHLPTAIDNALIWLENQD